MLDELHVYDDRDAGSAAFNMAVDEALLERAAAPLLRFYRWRRPSLSFGYFGQYAEVAAQASDREIVRRWTGGGIVPHGDDLTYSVIIPATNSFFAHSSLEIYARLHEVIRLTLQANDIEASLAGSAASKVSEACFANAVRADVLHNGKKIAGAAHRRTRAGLLHQGSIQCRELPDRFRDDLARILCPRFERKTFAPDLRLRATAIAAAKYGTAEWLKRR
jgi:lipoyl(octanoyl) transferase